MHTESATPFLHHNLNTSDTTCMAVQGEGILMYTNVSIAESSLPQRWQTRFIGYLISCLNSTSSILPQKASFQRPKKYCTTQAKACSILNGGAFMTMQRHMRAKAADAPIRDTEQEKRGCTCWVVGWLVSVPRLMNVGWYERI